MKVTQIKNQVKNPERVSIFVDEKYSFSLTLDQLLEYKLKKGLELDEPQIKQFKKLSDEGKQKVRAIEWLLNRPHSIREFRDYGFRKKLEKELIDAWIEEFSEKKYLDDEAFARWFVDNRVRKNKSKRSIIAELTSKGVPRDMAERLVSEQQNDSDSLETLVVKLRIRSRYKDEQKLIVYLLSKGFSYDDVKKALNVMPD